MNSKKISLVECPRDAIQGISKFISTEKKISYINELISSNLFEYIDFGSFVSTKAIPQMRDTSDVLEGLIKNNQTKLLAIIANERGAEIASSFNKVDYLGYPFSISETFQLRNTNSTIVESFERVRNIISIITNSAQELVIYISMAFGNPYGDEWNIDKVIEWVDRISQLGISRFSIADTTSEASSKIINDLFTILMERFPTLDFSIHLHSTRESSMIKIDAAYEAGCRRFEGAFLGYGGCPFAKDILVGNIPSELLLSNFKLSNSIQINDLTSHFEKLLRDDSI